MHDDTATKRATDQSAGDDGNCADAAEQGETARVALAAFYADPDAAHRRLEALMKREGPMDRISILGRADASGDDPLGIYYPGVGERVRGWGSMGALWGGVFGLLGGAVGLFVLPGVGTLGVAGPLVSSLAGGVAGAGAGGAVLAGAGAGQELAVAIHRMGIPESCIADMQQRLADGETLILMVMDTDDAERWRPVLEDPEPPALGLAAGSATADDTAEEAMPRPVALWELPFTGFVEAAREQF